jgi:hypothetical protein
MKIYQLVQKLLGQGTQTETDGWTDIQTNDLMSILSFLENSLVWNQTCSGVFFTFPVFKL